MRRIVGHEVSENVAKNVRLLRHSHKLTIEALADLMGFTPAVITNIENGRPKLGSRTRHIDVDELSVLANIFGIADPWSLTKTPECGTCNGAPPVGFKCNTCGLGGYE